MADNRVYTPSVVERTRPIAPAGSGIVDAHFLGRTAAFVRGDEAILPCRRRAKPGARQRWTGKQIAAETCEPPLAEFCAASA
jgi:hypothetical protein